MEIELLPAFQRLDWPSFPDALPTLMGLLANGTIGWHGNQICLTTIPGREDDIHLGTGSLLYDWDNSTRVSGIADTTSIQVPERQDKLSESDFVVLCRQFRGTVFEDMHRYMLGHHAIGRLRLMQMQPKTCLTWHVDTTPRIHYPLLTHAGCYMVIDSEVMHLDQDLWYLTETRLPHTAFNGSKDSRIHLVGTMI